MGLAEMLALDDAAAIKNVRVMFWPRAQRGHPGFDRWRSVTLELLHV